MMVRFAAALYIGAAAAQPLPVDEIMARVAANQDRAQELRRSFVYSQNVLMRFHRGNGKLAREERAEYTVSPTPKGVEKKLVAFEGKYERGGRYVSFDTPGYKYKSEDLDGELMDDFAHDLIQDRKSRDGIGRDLFPLTAAEQKKYTFKLAGTEQYRGRDTWKVRFEPRKGQDFDEAPWAGEALIDVQEFQPVLVSSRFGHRIPLAVKALLGTNIKGLGFNIVYQKFDAGVWFPVSYGGEFEVRVLFLYKREMSISLANNNFQRTAAESTVAYHLDDK